MKKKRLWLSVALTVLVVVCAMLILSRVNEARSNAVPTAPTDLILPPDIRTTAAPTQKTYDDLPDVDISSWEYLIASQAHNISDYVPDVSKISGSQSTFDSRAVDALNALLKAARSAGWSPYIYCAYRPYLTQKQQYEDQVSAYMREGDTRDEAETAAARVAAPPGTSDHQTGLGADVVSVEPIAQDNPLLTSPNTLLTPHIAWATRTARQNITRIIAENIAGWMAGQPKSVVNKAYLNG